MHPPAPHHLAQTQRGKKGGTLAESHVDVDLEDMFGTEVKSESGELDMVSLSDPIEKALVESEAPPAEATPVSAPPAVAEVPRAKGPEPKPKTKTKRGNAKAAKPSQPRAQQRNTLAQSQMPPSLA